MFNQDGFPEIRGKREQGIPNIIKKLSATGTHLQRKIGFFSNRISLGILTKLEGMPNVQMKMANTQ